MSISEVGLSKNQANFAALSPLSFLERTRKTFPNHTAIEYKNYQLSYEQAGSRCDALANFLKKRNIDFGSTIAVMLPNIPVMWECHYGIPMASGVMNAINTRLDSNTVKFILEHGEAKLFIYDSLKKFIKPISAFEEFQKKFTSDFGFCRFFIDGSTVHQWFNI